MVPCSMPVPLPSDLVVLNRSGIETESACSGKPEGLSFSNTKVPVSVAGVSKVSTTSNGTNSVVIQSPLACAGKATSSLPFASKSRTGNEASKYQFPLASPRTRSGLSTKAFGRGSVMRILSLFTRSIISVNDFSPARHWRGYVSITGKPRRTHRSKLSALFPFCHWNTKHQSSSHWKRKMTASPAITTSIPMMIMINFIFINTS